METADRVQLVQVHPTCRVATAHPTLRCQQASGQTRVVSFFQASLMACGGRIACSMLRGESPKLLLAACSYCRMIPAAPAPHHARLTSRCLLYSSQRKM